MKVSVMGLGWFGDPLGMALKQAGHEVIGTKRKKSESETGIRIFEFSYPSLPPAEVLDADILVLNIPPFEGELEWFRRWKFKKEPWVIFISSTSRRGPLPEQEEWIKGHFKDWTILRFAGLLGGERHPGKHLAGRKNIKGRLWAVRLLFLDDAIGFTHAVIEKGIKHETIDVVSDERSTKEKFYTEYAKKMGLPLPEFDPADTSTRLWTDNSRAKEIYQFTWPLNAP